MNPRRNAEQQADRDVYDKIVINIRITIIVVVVDL